MSKYDLQDDAYEKMRAQLLLIRHILGLNPIHDPVECVRVLHEQGREAFEKLRGERCDFAHEWNPAVGVPERYDEWARRWLDRDEFKKSLHRKLDKLKETKA